MFRNIISKVASRFLEQRSIAAPHRRTRLGVEVMEDRLTPTTRTIVPFDIPVNNTTTFHTLRTALLTGTLASGDIVEIKQGATPGGITNSLLPNVTNLTIRGEAGTGAKELSEVTFNDAITITPARQGFTLQNVNAIFTNGFTFQANGTLASNRITVITTTDGINISSGVLNAVIRDNQIYGTVGSNLIDVAVTTSSQNVISGNFITSSQSAILVSFSGTAVTGDVMRDNILVGPEGNTSTAMVSVGAGVDGLTIDSNTFRDADFSDGAVAGSAGVKNLKILRNTIDFPAQVNIGALRISGGASGLDTSSIISGNIIRVGSGTAILLSAVSTGTFKARVEGNDILTASIGIFVNGSGIPLTDVDLGGGTQGSAGGNNFRFQKTAASSSAATIVTSGLNGPVQALNNIFGAIGAEASIFDFDDDSLRPNVVATGSLTGNAAFAQGLYVRFLHRVANLSNPNDGGNLVAGLNNGTISATAAVNAISRSAEAFGFVVNDLYHSILNRDPDAGGKAAFVTLLANGSTLESVKATFFASQEYLNRFAGDRAFVVSLYSTVLGRTASDAEYQSWVNLIPSIGRSGVASGLLNSVEARAQTATRLYISLLKRAASQAEINAWATSGLGELDIQTAITASAEGQAAV